MNLTDPSVKLIACGFLFDAASRASSQIHSFTYAVEGFLNRKPSMVSLQSELYRTLTTGQSGYKQSLLGDPCPRVRVSQHLNYLLVPHFQSLTHLETAAYGAATAKSTSSTAFQGLNLKKLAKPYRQIACIAARTLTTCQCMCSRVTLLVVLLKPNKIGT